MAKQSKSSGNGIKNAKVSEMTKPAPKPMASVITEFSVPQEQQAKLREFDTFGTKVHQELGALEVFYQTRKHAFMAEFERNRKEYQVMLNEIAKGVGVDFENLAADEQWNFDFQNMTFRKVPPKTN